MKREGRNSVPPLPSTTARSRTAHAIPAVASTTGQARTITSIHLVVRPDRLKQDGLLALVRNERKDDAKIVPGTTGPQALQITLELVCPETRMMGIVGELLQGSSQTSGGFRILLEETLSSPNERLGADEPPTHDRISSINSSAVVGRQRPSVNSRWASRASALTRLRPRSDARLRTISTNASWSSADS
jgi:hypothetical protein